MFARVLPQDCGGCLPCTDGRHIVRRSREAIAAPPFPACTDSCAFTARCGSHSRADRVAERHLAWTADRAKRRPLPRTHSVAVGVASAMPLFGAAAFGTRAARARRHH